jgi:hypothetical protein
VLELLVGLGRGGGAEHVAGGQLAVPAAQPFQAVLFFFEFGHGELGDLDLLVDLGVEFGAVCDELGPLLGPLGGEPRLQPGSVRFVASAAVSTVTSPSPRCASAMVRAIPSANTGASGTAHTPWPNETAPARRSSRQTATRCRVGSAGTRTINTSQRIESLVTPNNVAMVTWAPESTSSRYVASSCAPTAWGVATVRQELLRAGGCHSGSRAVYRGFGLRRRRRTVTLSRPSSSRNGHVSETNRPGHRVRQPASLQFTEPHLDAKFETLKLLDDDN